MNLAGVRVWAALAAVLLAGVAGFGCRHVDYFYGHAVSGRVVDTAGRPVAGAVVARVDTATGKVLGLESLYLRRTGADGTFRFQYRGLGPKPEAEKIWHLKASRPGYTAVQTTLRLPWVRGPKGRPRGYQLSGVLLKLSGGKAKK